MRTFIVILLILAVVGGIYAFRTGMIQFNSTPVKTSIEVDTGRMKQEIKDTVHKLDEMVIPHSDNHTVPTPN